MNLKKSDVNILIILLGFLIPVGVYFFVYNNFTEKTAALNGQNAVLQTEVDYLQDLADHKQEYIDETENMQVSIAEIKTHFPAEYKPEDDILYVVGLENDYGTKVPSMTMGLSSMIEVAAPEAPMPEAAPVETDIESLDAEVAVAEGDTVDAPAPQISLFTTPVAVTMQSSYRSLKDIIYKLNNDPNRKSIDAITAVFDTETGQLAVSLAYSAYSLTGTETTYQEPVVNGIFYGTNDIFKTGEKSAAIIAEKKAEEEAAEE